MDRHILDGSSETVLPQLVPETALAHTEQPSRPRLHLLGLLKGAENHLPLDLIEGLFEPNARSLLALRLRGRLEVEERGPDGVALAQHDGTLNYVLKLANVAGPRIVLKQAQRPR